MDPASLFDTARPTYDVVIPCCNRAHVVTDAVESVLAQAPAPRRVIIVDDGSSDDSAAVIRGLATTHASVEAVVLPRNVGASQARNTGAGSSHAPWIAFLDSDDVWLPGAAQALLDGTGHGAFEIVVGHFARVEEHEAPDAPECGWDGDCIRRGLASGGVVGPSWSIVSRAIVDRIGGFDPSFHNCNDWDFYTRAAAAGARFTRINNCVALYRTVAGSRLVGDTDISARNALRVLANPYLAGPNA
ncbi:MAG: glycosyltransferase family 2 protein [Lysobacteraceae bacterium]|nr:MAG: glycosyltransferase family 2 protein [Xanthomonadaceae bacterium]